MTTPNTVFVPGHGQLGKREDLIARFSIETVVHPTDFYDANLEGATKRWYDRLFEEAKAHVAQR